MILANGIELAARFVEKRRDDYVQEHGSYDPSTGVTEFPGDGEEYVGELEEIIEGVRALAAAPARAAEPLNGATLGDIDLMTEALQPFARALAIHDALPEGFKPGDETPLRECLAGIWPTVADLRRLVEWGIDRVIVANDT